MDSPTEKCTKCEGKGEYWVVQNQHSDWEQSCMDCGGTGVYLPPVVVNSIEIRPELAPPFMHPWTCHCGMCDAYKDRETL